MTPLLQKSYSGVNSVMLIELSLSKHLQVVHQSNVFSRSKESFPIFTKVTVDGAVIERFANPVVIRVNVSLPLD